MESSSVASGRRQNKHFFIATLSTRTSFTFYRGPGALRPPTNVLHNSKAIAG
jgi:hypothetical protein